MVKATDMLRSLAKGVVAGFVGTAAMTAYQLAVAKAQGKPLATPVHRTAGADAPAPAQAAKKVADALGHGRRFTREDVPRLTNVMHWLYGIILGREELPTASRSPRRAAGRSRVRDRRAWGGVVRASSVAARDLPAWLRGGIPPKELALDLSYHLVYCGLAVAGRVRPDVGRASGLPCAVVFDSLADKLQGALGDLRKKGKLDEESISRAMREIRLALPPEAGRQLHGRP